MRCLQIVCTMDNDPDWTTALAVKNPSRHLTSPHLELLGIDSLSIKAISGSERMNEKLYPSIVFASALCFGLLLVQAIVHSGARWLFQRKKRLNMGSDKMVSDTSHHNRDRSGAIFQIPLSIQEFLSYRVSTFELIAHSFSP